MREVIYTKPTLYSLSSKGKIKQWYVCVIKNLESNEIKICSSHGYLDCKMICEYSSAIEGKNLGKKNETTPEQQAISEADSKWNKKIDQNYSETIPSKDSSFTKIRPMLAHKWNDRKHYIKFPCYVQPKLNGIRTLSQRNDGRYKFTSKSDKEFTTLNTISNQLVSLGLNEKVILDGEIYTDSLTFQEIISGLKRAKENTEVLEFWIFDIADTYLNFRQRLILLEGFRQEIFNNENTLNLKIVPTYIVNNEEELMNYHREFSLSYEGTIIRNMEGLYLFDYRSNDLLKHKDFIDEEFIITGGKEGTGNDEGTVIFQCITNENKTFDVRPRGTREMRVKWYKELLILVGKNLTVRYQNLSDDGIPIFPVGLAIRDYE